MHFITIALAYALFVISNFIGVTGLSLPHTDVSESSNAFGIKGNYQMATSTFEGNFNGQNVSLQGHAAKVVAQLEALHPGSTESLSSRGAANTADGLPVARELSLAPRNKDGILCTPVAGQSFWFADIDGVEQGINYMQWLSDNYFTVTALPRTCLVMVCFRQASIILCNDNNYAISPALDYLASYAQDITNACRTGGQQFDTDHYNVITAGNGRC